MVKVKRLMETDDKGVKREFILRTHVSAIDGLEKVLAGNSPVLTVNGKTGNIWITAETLGIPIIEPELIEKMNQVINAYENGELDGSGESSIKFEPVENENEEESEPNGGN